MRMTSSARTRLSATRAVDPDVYEAYLKGRYYWNQRSEISIKTAITYFDSAIALDPMYAPHYAAVADCYNQLATLILSTIFCCEQVAPRRLTVSVPHRPH